MATYKINTRDAIVKMLAQDPPVIFQDMDVLIHKPFESYDIEQMIKETYPNATIIYCNAGTEAYTEFGYNTSIITIAGQPNAQ